MAASTFSPSLPDGLVAVLLLLLLGVGCAAQRSGEAPDVEARIESLLSEMTLQEKVDMIHASSSFTSGGVERLGIPELVMSDGPHGVRHEHTRYYDKATGVADRSTYLPVGTALAATWNRELGYEFGAVLGREAAYRGKDVILGPGLNIIRDPRNGRNFEYLTEDPYLNARMVVGYIRGVQDQGVAASAKHYVANSLEYERRRVNVVMDERTFREIYLPGFRAAVQEAGVLTVMAAYNRFRGQWCAQSTFLLDDVLKGELAFTGVVMSDWNAVNDTLAAARAGLDIEMGTDLGQEWGKPDYDAFYLADPLIALVEDGTVAEELIDRKVRRILRVMHAIHIFSGDRPEGAYNTAEHQAVARRVADESIVLLQNDGLLPLRRKELRTLAVIGANADRRHAGAGGSSQVKAAYEVTALEGIRSLVGDQVEVTWAPGYEVAPGATADPALVREAAAAAAAADAVVYVGGLVHGFTDAWEDNAYDAEAVDKPDMMLPFGQDALLAAVLAANPRTVVVLQSGGPVDMRAWRSDARAVVQAWYGGMEGGSALAAVLFGEVNPSGRLPMTFPEKLEDSPAHALASYPGEDLLIEHEEGLYVGYRYFDSYGVEPAFPFGHGLSYTTFEYSDLDVVRSDDESVRVAVRVTNVGSLPGAEVVQVYVRDVESSLPRPDRELKEFAKVELAPGGSADLTFDLGREAFSYYDPERRGWVLEPGIFEVLVGSSSRDVRARGRVEI
ncbi:MAG: glycoside hydrolase family 3 C-terminal domain-containing protein [Thermoanaerobaculia bacterium]|nr:glycoside hydrolase family 3 C-terminal domain-containing protein [Thermoanaerobaculia bacterium]